MAWIEAHQGLARHPKTRRLARLLNLPLPTVIGHLFLLWWWALDYAQDGNLGKFCADDISDAVDYKGDSSELVSALTTAGFIDSNVEWRNQSRRNLDTDRLKKEQAALYEQYLKPPQVTRVFKIKEAN